MKKLICVIVFIIGYVIGSQMMTYLIQTGYDSPMFQMGLGCVDWLMFAGGSGGLMAAGFLVLADYVERYENHS